MANINTTYLQRYPIELLPEYLQTDALKKVFNATVNHLFQPASVEFLDGYVGHIPPWYNPLTDFYIPEPDANRQNYQLDPTVVSSPYNNPELTNAMFYEDLIGQLAFQGALVNNHDRLFAQEYYSWSPPIDLDMFTNYTNYFWLPNGPDAIILLNTTDLVNTAAGQTAYSYVGSVIYSSNNTTATFTASAPLVFTTGLKIIPKADQTLLLNDQELIIGGVGRSIQLINFSDIAYTNWDLGGWDLYGWSGVTDPTTLYVTIARGSSDGNQWSSQNRWFHIDIINISKTLVSNISNNQAARPIIQFDVDTQLWNYGTNNRGIITIVDTVNTSILKNIVGQPYWTINGVPLQDGMRILSLADNSPEAAGKIFIVSGQANGAIQLTVDTSGCHSSDGQPTQGDRATVQFGLLQGQNIYYNNGVWTTNCQQLIGLTPPLFQLYDIDGNSMSDPSVYPSSSFMGSQVFSYAIDPTQPIDPYLGQSVQLDQFGDWVFDNNLTTDTVTYVSNSTRINYNGYLFAQIGSTYIDSWYTAPQLSRQYIINQFDLTTDTTVFVIDQAPAAQSDNTLPTIFVRINVNQNDKLLVNGVDYTVSNNVVTLTVPAVAGSIVEIASWNPVAPVNITGYYQIPLNISANPNNLPITSVARSQFLQQFQEIIENQTGIVGPALGKNNYRDTAQQRGLGLSILQHRAPMIKLNLLNSVPLNNINLTTAPTDPVQAMQYAENSYTRFYNRFLRALFNVAAQQGYTASSDPNVCNPYNTALWITTALNQINIGKTPASPWANTGYGGPPGAYGLIQATNPLYIPATATRLGITSAFTPMVYFDTSYLTPQLTIQTHDGARIVMVDNQGVPLGTILHNQSMTTNPEQLTNPVAAAWLQFELNMFNNLPPAYSNPEATLVFDITTYAPGRWRTTDYTAAEYIQLQRGAFDKWVINNQIDYQSNTGYNPSDPFSFNYSTVTDQQGNSIPGGWQGIYRWFYDTDRPHICPWEMLGFSQEPLWWTEQYGAAPYTSGNTALWQDLASGIIRQGQRAGTYSVWARPGLMSCIPVDAQGNLLPPVLSGCAAYLPTATAAQAPWIFGDGGPVESAWIHSQYYPFVESVTGYLMKPAAFVEYTWDSLRTQEIYPATNESQWIYIDTNTRRASDQFYINRETPNTLVTGVYVPDETNLAYFASAGFQVWITEYVVSQGLSVTNFIGSVIRGGNVKLAHRMAGYINTTNLRGVVDSFGQIGYNSQIIPNENISTYLYRSTSTGNYYYSGVIVQQVVGGWKIYGYDAIEQFFTIIPSNTSGSKINIAIGNQQVTEYQTGLTNSIKIVLYNTVLTSYQQVYDFLISYGRWLTSQGWVFETYSSNAGAVLNWSQSAKEYLLWAQGSWANGTLIALSPSAASTQFTTPVGMINYVNGIISGTYPVVDRAGQPIQSQHLDVLRNEGVMTVQPNNTQGIYGMRLFTTTIEHAVFFDNLTAFGDVIYEPLYNLQQQRIKLYTYRANGWNGTINAPGYVVIQNNTTVNGQTVSSNTWTMTNNFDKTASDFTKYFNIDEPKNYSKITYGGVNTITSSSTLGSIDNQAIANISKHTIGYQPRAYLQNLLLDESVEFQFYQGFIRQKGTLSSINALLRSSSIIPTGSTFNYFDEWMIRVGTYGATAFNVDIEYILPQSYINYDPQWIRFFSSTSNNPNDNVFDIVPNDPLLITPPATYTTKIFGLRNSYASDPATDIPTAGYAQLGETNWYVANTSELKGLYSSVLYTNRPLNFYDTVWQFITDNGSWMVWILSPAASQPSYTIPSTSFGTPTTIVTSGPHGLLNGDLCVVFGVAGTPAINNTYVIGSVTPTTFNIQISTFTAGSGGTIWVYRPMRFANIFDRDTSAPPGGYQEGNLVYVDQGGIIPNAWTVYHYVRSQFVPYRQQPLQVDPNLLQSSAIYNIKTGKNLASLEYWDPVKGKIPGQAQQELTFITDVDPATYNSGDTAGYLVNPSLAWSSAQIGQTWWDVAQVRYLDYEQGDDSYRLRTWGQIAPGTAVVVYEWIQSSVSPTDWATSVAAGTAIMVNGSMVIPSGTVKEPYNWVQLQQYNNQNQPTTYYYFWVGNSGLPPSGINRRLSTSAIATLIQRPSQTGVPWYAAISQNSIILGNVQNLLNGLQVAQRINYTSKANNANIYSEWELIRQGDPNSPINTTVWSRLKASLVTFDGMGNDVPDYHLNAYNRYGTFIRPRQTWFVNRVSASELFVSTFNNLAASSNTPLVYDAGIASWLNYFDAAEPIPTQFSNILLSVTGTAANRVVVTSTLGMIPAQPVVFNSSIGGLIGGTTYYVLAITSQTTFSVSMVPGGEVIELADTSVTTTATETVTVWDYQVADLTQRDGLIGAILPGQLILCDANSSTDNKWSIWQYTNNSQQYWSLTRIQSYNTANYWQYVNWYATGYSAETPPNTSVETIADLYAIANPTQGQLVEVVNGGDGNYQWWAYSNSAWSLVCQQNGTMQVLPSVYQWAETSGGFDGSPFDAAGTSSIFNPLPVFDDNAAIEFANIIDGIYLAIFPGPNSIELNSLFFAMTNFVVAEQLQADWIFKTSNIVFNGFNQTLGQPPLLAVNNTNSILAFINETKPYHANIQDYTNGYSALDPANASVVDFDVPFAYLTTNTPSNAVNPSNITVNTTNLEGIEYRNTYSAWYENYHAATSVTLQQYIDPNLVRQLTTKMVFDRISNPALLLGWGSTWSIFGWSNENAGQNFGALTRIEDNYAPTPGMIPNVISDLMQGVVYRGQTIGNLGFSAEPGWSAGPWGGLLGWDADRAVVDAYLDQIIQGGQIPDYDTAVGDGQTVTFPLKRGAQNPNSLVVWSDGGLRLYGVDWFVPTYAINAYVFDGGTGYSIGDQINVLAGSGIVPVRLQVTEVSHGSITAVNILGKGSYTTVQPGPYKTQYPPAYPGFGTNAMIGVDWSCAWIQFTTPPASSATPNVFILYIGTTFESAATNPSDSIYDGYEFVQPYVDDNHPEELYPMLPRDCLIMDTYIRQNGGRPLVSARAYVTDGTTSQYDLLVTPQSDQAVMAYLNGSALTVGTGGDVVVNYNTRKLVFINTPPPDQMLYITAIGFGGASRGIAAAYVVSGGNGYVVGDTLTLSAGIPFQPGTSVRPAQLTVTNVGVHNSVVATNVLDLGLYPQLPPQPIAATGGHGNGANFIVSFTDDFQMYHFTGDGVNKNYPVPGTSDNFQPGVMLNIDGILTPIAGYTSTGVYLSSAPDYGSTVTLASFTTSQFSVVQETLLTINNSSELTYTITQASSTQPNYISTMVRRNGLLLTPPLLQEWSGNQYQTHFNITVDLTNAVTTTVYIDSALQVIGVDYTIQNNVLIFAAAPINLATIVLVCVNPSTHYTIAGTSITFAAGSIQVDDTVIITTYTQDIDYQFHTDEFTAVETGTYTLTAYPEDPNTIQVWYNKVLQVPQQDYTLSTTAASSGWGNSGWDNYVWAVPTPKMLNIILQQPDAGWANGGWAVSQQPDEGWDYLPPININYMTGRPQAPAISWRTTTGWDATLSTALDNTRMTYILSNVYTYSSTIEVADVSVLTLPNIGIPGLIYINNELISFMQVQPAPTAVYPNRAFLAGIARNRLGTSGLPQTVYNTFYYNGNGINTVFASESASQAISTTVFVNGQMQIESIDYQFVTNPTGYPAGYYVRFIAAAPGIGIKNIRIACLNQISYKTKLSHAVPANVIDAGQQVEIPGGYSWVATPNGLQYSDSSLGIFLLEHSAETK